MRNKKRRLIGGLVVVVAAGFAACMSRSEPETSTTAQAVFFQPNGGSSGSSYCGSAALYSTIDCPEVTITPNTGDNYLLRRLDASNCQFMRTELADDPTGKDYPITCLPFGPSMTVGEGSDVDTCIPSTYTVLARYVPQFQGSASCTMYATLDNQNFPFDTLQLSIYYSGYGIPPQSGIQVSRTSIDLGQVPVNTSSAPGYVTVTNVGSTSVTVNMATQPATVFAHNQGSDSFTLPASGSGSNSRSVGISCRPPSVGPQSGSITFSTPTTGSGSSQTVSLSCTGITSSLNIVPSPAAFAPTLVHATATPTSISIYAGSGTDYLTDVQLDASSSADLAITSGAVSNGQQYIDSGSGHSVVLQYTPTQAHTGSLGRLVVSSVNNPSPRSVEIIGEAQLGKVAAAPGGIDFGPVCVGSTARETFEVYAEAPGTFNLMEFAAPGAPFSVTSTQFDPGMQLLGNRGNAVAFTASVAPTAPGDLTGTVTMNTNLPAQLNPMLPLQLHAVALPAGVSPTPGAIDFGPNKILMPSLGRTVVLSNCGDAAVEIADIRRITGANAAEFTVVSPPSTSVTVPPNGEVELLVVMTPTTPGAKTAQLELVHPGGTAVAMLNGTAFDESGGSDGEMGTYYSCSAGAGAGFAPVGFALLLLRRRRRRT